MTHWLRRIWCLIRCRGRPSRYDPNGYRWRCQGCGCDWGSGV